MPTRQEVLDDIKAIEDDGNNKASEVRTVLRSLLDYTENETINIPNLESLHFWNNGKPVLEEKEYARLWYSLMLIPVFTKEQNPDIIPEYTLNFTFRLKINEFGPQRFSFLLNEDQDVIEILQKAYKSEGADIRFCVPFIDSSGKFPSASSVVMRMSSEGTNNLVIHIDSQEGTYDSEIFTSIYLHAPKFEFEGDRVNVLRDIKGNKKVKK